jgi:branched-chain amino acid transport system ATP-binding protein
MPERLLELDGVTMRFGGVSALDGVNLHVDQGEILGLIGPNGAGKTTVFNVVTGVYRPTIGVVRFEGKPLGKTPRHVRTKVGIARTFQNIRLFPAMSALDNVAVGVDTHARTGVGATLGAFRSAKREEAATKARAMELLEFVGIADRSHEFARSLPYGYQRRLEIARALGTGPKLLCLDEPAAGFNPAEKSDLMALIRRIRDTGYTVLLIEHDMRLVMGVTDRIVVLDFGRNIAEGSPADIRSNPAVIAAYLGEPDDDDA